MRWSLMSFMNSYIEQHGMDLFNLFLNYVLMAFTLLVVFLVGYIISYMISAVIKKILGIKELKKTLVLYGAMTTKLWDSITNFISHYLKWYLTIAFLTAVEIKVIQEIFVFMGNLLWFIVLGILGLAIGGIAYKITKDALMHMGLDSELDKHKISGALGGFTLSSVLAGIVKWYIALIFVAQGIAKVNLPKLSQFMDELMAYIPSAILGLVILIVALLVSNLSAVRIRVRKTSISEATALFAQVLIVFFGVVLALPKFGVQNVSILEDSFKILSVGLSLGIGLAVGLGLKEPISRLGEKYSK